VNCRHCPRSVVRAAKPDLAHSIAAADHEFTKPSRYGASVISKTHEEGPLCSQRHNITSSELLPAATSLSPSSSSGTGKSSTWTQHRAQGVPHPLVEPKIQYCATDQSGQVQIKSDYWRDNGWSSSSRGTMKI
jgi:hypothetical protein